MKAFRIFQVPNIRSEEFYQFIGQALQPLYDTGFVITNFYHEMDMVMVKKQEVLRVFQEVESIPDEFVDENDGVMLVVDWCYSVCYLVSPDEITDMIVRAYENKSCKLVLNMEWYGEPLMVTCTSCKRPFDYNKYEVICPYCDYDNSVDEEDE